MYNTLIHTINKETVSYFHILIAICLNNIIQFHQFIRRTKCKLIVAKIVISSNVFIYYQIPSLLKRGLHSACRIVGFMKHLSSNSCICFELKLDKPIDLHKPFNTNFSMALQVSTGSISSAKRKCPSSSFGHIWSPCFYINVNELGAESLKLFYYKINEIVELKLMFHG